MGFLFFKAHYENIGYQRAVKEQKNAIAKITKIQTKVIKQIETVYVPKLKVIHEVGKTIYKEVPVYVTPANDRQCTINNGFVRLWNYANQSVPLPSAALMKMPQKLNSLRLQPSTPARPSSVTQTQSN